jgi:hypothetical protein
MKETHNKELNNEPHCEAQLLHQYVEEELDPIRTALVRQHLKSCAACRGERDAIEAERLWLLEAAVDAPLLSGRFQEKILERVREAKRRDALKALLGRAASFAAAFLVIGLTAVTSTAPAPRFLPPSARGVAYAPEAISPGGTPLPACSSECPEQDFSLSLAVIADRMDHARLVSRTLPHARIGPIFVSNFGDVAGIAVQLTPSSRPAFYRFEMEGPCKPDPNKDGKMDLNDVAYSCQLLIGGLEPHSLETKDVSFPLADSDCDDVCLKA